MTDYLIIITRESQARRLDHFLVQKMPDLSRSKIQKMIEAGQVLVNGQKPTKHRFLKVGDMVVVTQTKTDKNKKDSPILSSAGKYNQNDQGLWDKIKIIDDTPDYLVIDKPTGLLVHPTDREEKDTLIDWAISKYPEVRNIGEDPRRAAIVHRLDKEVSGLMVIPKTQAAFEYFKKLFKLRRIKKKYVTLVYGEVKGDSGEIDFAIARGRGRSGLFTALPVGDSRGKPAKTLFKIVKRFKNYTLLEVEILSGRTHQIRVHLKAFGHPLVGDELYKSKNYKTKIKTNRIFLHASLLKFFDLHGKEKKYEVKLPEELEEILEKVK